MYDGIAQLAQLFVTEDGVPAARGTPAAAARRSRTCTPAEPVVVQSRPKESSRTYYCRCGTEWVPRLSTAEAPSANEFLQP